jgi:APA family basic amino acid/polyamine antiporter
MRSLPTRWRGHPGHGLAVGNLRPRVGDRAVAAGGLRLFSSLSAFIIPGRGYYAGAGPLLLRPRAGSTATRADGLDRAQGAAACDGLARTFDQIDSWGSPWGSSAAAVVGLVVIRRRGWGTYRMPLYPAVPLFFVTANLSILTLAFLERPTSRRWRS